MYSGTTFSNFSGNLLGAHQKINRSARKVLSNTVNTKHFPSKKLIIHFEGRNGPDGIKAKSPAQNEPWHFYDPFDPEDDQLLDIINEHYVNLVSELRAENIERAAFEASWLAHAVVDGLTPAHHYPYEDELMELRGGESIDTRTTIKEKLVMKGDKPSEVFKNNWKMWGAKGVFVTHGLFELGVAALIQPINYGKIEIGTEDLMHSKEIGVEQLFEQAARRIALMNLYDEYARYGWTVTMARKVRDDLMPEIISTVALTWYLALNEAGFAARLPKS